MALWDIKRKACRLPVYQLLGGLARTKVRVYGHVGGNTAAEAARQAKQRVAKGITAIRFRAFHSYDAVGLHDHKLAVQQQIEYLAAVREAVGDEIDLILECHGRYDPQWAIELAKRAEPYRPFMIEAPIRHENPQALAQVRSSTRIPLATGERYHNKWDFHEAVVGGYVNYLRPDVCHCGGISELRKNAAFGEVFYLDLIPHNNAGPLGTAATRPARHGEVQSEVRPRHTRPPAVAEPARFAGPPGGVSPRHRRTDRLVASRDGWGEMPTLCLPVGMSITPSVPRPSKTSAPSAEQTNSLQVAIQLSHGKTESLLSGGFGR